MRHKHADLIKAWADGAEIQCLQTGTGNWLDVDPHWDYRSTYRIKPEPKPDVVAYIGIGILEHGYANAYSSYCYIDEDTSHINNYEYKVKLTFDGETGELKSAEVIK